MDDQCQDNDVMAEDGTQVEVAEAATQPLLQIEPSEECLEDDQARERGEGLVFEAEVGDRVELAVDRRSGRLHAGGFLLTGGFFLGKKRTRREGNIFTSDFSTLHFLSAFTLLPCARTS